MMKILISNDDGYNSEGIMTLAKLFSKENEVIIFAPENERSAFGQSITMSNPLRVTNVKNEKNLKIFHVNGTPADCVKIGLNLLETPPDLILSGINKGTNTGFNTRYSGTIGAAFEGVIKNIPSFAISLVIDKNKPLFQSGAEFIYNTILKIFNSDFDFHMTLININLPNIEKIKGIKSAFLNKNFYNDRYEKRVDTFGKDYYWLAGEFNMEIDEKRSDENILQSGFASITPIKVDQTDYEKLEKLDKLL